MHSVTLSYLAFALFFGFSFFKVLPFVVTEFQFSLQHENRKVLYHHITIQSKDSYITHDFFLHSKMSDVEQNQK